MAVFESNHPLVKHKVSLLRENNISVKSFRELANEITLLLTAEATSNFTTSLTEIDTWAGKIDAPILNHKSPTLVPLLRAGLGMLDGVLTLLPCAKVSVVGLQRNEDTLKPECYYQNIVSDISERTAIIIDPMLATGGSALATIALLKQSSCVKIIALFLVAAPEGIAALQEHYPDVDIYVASIDEKLNADGYILPGLGDAGDKLFGTL